MTHQHAPRKPSHVSMPVKLILHESQCYVSRLHEINSPPKTSSASACSMGYILREDATLACLHEISSSRSQVPFNRFMRNKFLREITTTSQPLSRQSKPLKSGGSPSIHELVDDCRDLTFESGLNKRVSIIFSMLSREPMLGPPLMAAPSSEKLLKNVVPA